MSAVNIPRPDWLPSATCPVLCQGSPSCLLSTHIIVLHLSTNIAYCLLSMLITSRLLSEHTQSSVVSTHLTSCLQFCQHFPTCLLSTHHILFSVTAYIRYSETHHVLLSVTALSPVFNERSTSRLHYCSKSSLSTANAPCPVFCQHIKCLFCKHYAACCLST